MSWWTRLQTIIEPATPLGSLQRLLFANVTLDARMLADTQQGITFDNVTVTSPITWDAALGNYLILTLTSNAAYTLDLTTTTLRRGQRLVLTVRNLTGVAAGAMTFAATFKASAVTQPANNFSRSYIFEWNGTNAIEVAKSQADVPV